MTRRARIIVWGASVLCVLVAAGLGALAVAGGLDRADKVASIVGAVIGLAGLVVSLYALHRSPAPGPVPPAPGPAAGTGSATVAEGVRSVAAGGSIGRAVTGDGVSLTGPAPVLPPSSGSGSGSGSGGGGAAGSARATGERSVAAGGDIGEAVTGDGPRA